MNRIPVALFLHRSEAEPLQQRLIREGIAAEVKEELWLQKLWFVSRAAAGVRVEVGAAEFERAEALLCAWDNPPGTLRGAIRCPECKSMLVGYPQFARNSVLTNVAAGFLAEVGLVEKDYYCEHCHFTWPKELSGPAPARPHLAPYYFIEDVNPASRPQAQPLATASAPDKPA